MNVQILQIKTQYKFTVYTN